MPSRPIQDSDIARCINNCIACARTCLETFQYCVEQKGTAFSGKHLSLLQYCADVCQFSVKLLIGDSQFAIQSCDLTLEICQACVAECERYDEDSVFSHCAEVCKDCIESCRGVAAMTVRVPGQKGKIVNSQSARI
ncbi:MAG: four-helix bundle copper-binding protein [Pseudobdellovibrionaceae bacterium]